MSSPLPRRYIIDDHKAGNPAIRSKTVIRSRDKKGFVDPSIATALGLSPESLLQDFKTFGFLFENLGIRDLRVCASAWRG